VALVCVVAGACPAGASAQAPGVHVDPESPTGREYDIPIERARREAAPTPGTAAGGSRSTGAPLFGEGIGDPSGSTGASAAGAQDLAAGSASSSRSSAAAASRRPPAPATSRRRAVPPVVAAAIRQPGAPPGGAGTSLAIWGAGALVIGFGVLAGMLLRRRSR
jgi:hypothetical protein